MEETERGTLTFAYADPPYPGTAQKWYGREADFGGEVDHEELVARLCRLHDEGTIAGWALSTSAKALRDVLPLCPEARVCAWVKPIGACPATFGIHNTWEPLIVVPGRQRRPGKRDWLSAQPARHGGTLPGRKPIAFIAWLWDLLGALPGDELLDLFPGTGIVGRAWRVLSFGAVADANVDASSTEYSGDELSPGAALDGSPPGTNDAIAEDLDDANGGAAA